MGDMANQFSGLPMESLIGGPLQAACNAQVQLAKAETQFINEVGLIENGSKDSLTTRTVDFEATRPVNLPDGTITSETMNIKAPVLSIVPIPALLIDEVDVKFNMEVKTSAESSSKTDASASLAGKAGWGPFSVKISGSVSTHRENTRKTDNSAKYEVHVHASQSEPPEGLMRVLDHLITACEPRSLTEAKTDSK